LTTLAGKTVGSSQDFDLTRTATRTRRNFLGAQLKYLRPERHEPFIYALWQRDNNHEDLFPPFQDFDYDSFYAGFGATGELTQSVRYETEWVYETGKSYGHRRFLRRNEIEAWALRAELEYLFRGDHKARASVEYLLGSGDPDRFASPTNTIGGNLGDFADNSFIGFGFRDTGLSFAPRYANLHMWRAGGSFYPWPANQRFRRLELGTDWYLYHKHHASAAVSDPTASVGSGYLGWEMDYYLNWRVTSDLAWTARLGAFFPGDAFHDTSARTFFLIGVTWSF
ncbi:MAG: alginate export family protein, partial [Planctomycetota bacterium]